MVTPFSCDHDVMAPRAKTADLLDSMVEHVRYEVHQVVHFVVIGNGWSGALRPDIELLVTNSVLEAGLMHLRCLVEFLGDRPRPNRVTARDYVVDWDWRTQAQLSRVSDLSDRVAHLGTARALDGNGAQFEWSGWLSQEAPVVLAGVRAFLAQLRIASPDRYSLFVQPHPSVQRVEWIPVLDALLAPR